MILPMLTGCARIVEPLRVTESRMGTYVAITIGQTGNRAAKRAIGNAFRQFEAVETALSTHRDDSEISRLNAQGYLDNPSILLYDNVRESLSFARLTDGAFDISVLPILDLYESRFGDANRIPTEDEIRSELELVDYRKIRLLDDRIELGEGQRITLGGIAKGYAVDLATEALIASGISSAIVEAGGDLRVIGSKNIDAEWHIAIQHPRDEGEYITRLTVPDMAVVTSGDYQRYYDGDREYHHIINPKTGRSATELISVTVIAESAFAADALSTAAFVLGPSAGVKLIESLDRVEALFISRSRRIIRTSGFSHYEVRT
jgi:FAD:protein FMN transferase